MKCKSCGAHINKENEKDSYCLYCGAPFENNRVESNPTPAPIRTQNNSTHKPKFNIFICLICLMFGVVPFIIYLIYISSQQSK